MKKKILLMLLLTSGCYEGGGSSYTPSQFCAELVTAVCTVQIECGVVSPENVYQKDCERNLRNELPECADWTEEVTCGKEKTYNAETASRCVGAIYETCGLELPDTCDLVCL